MIFKDIWLDIKAVQERDPAARNALEVFLLYQGIHALIWHRFAHWFYKHRMFFVARLISQIARFFTLIEIHPGAQLGRGILIRSCANYPGLDSSFYRICVKLRQDNEQLIREMTRVLERRKPCPNIQSQS